MAIAVSWVGYDPNTFVQLPVELTALDLGTADFSSNSLKNVIGLKFQGSSVQNVHLWRDGDEADVYYHDVASSELVQTNLHYPLQDNGYSVIAVADPCNTGSTTYNNPLDTWTTIPTSNASPLSIGSAYYLNQNFVAYTEPIAIAVTTPATDPTINSGNPYTANIVNWRLLAEFETTDNISP